MNTIEAQFEPGHHTQLAEFAHSFQDDETDFDPFSRNPQYRVENLELCALAHRWLSDFHMGIDLATGTGLFPQLMGPLTLAVLRRAIVFGIDADQHAIENAKKQTPTSESYQVHYIHGLAQDMDRLLQGRIPKEGVDMVSIFNSIHEIPKKDRAGIVQAGADKLKPGGIFVANSFFTSIAIKGREAEWSMPIGRAAVIHGGEKSDHPGFVDEPPEYYDQLFLDVGLKRVHYSTSDVTFPTQALIDICRYAGFVEGIMSVFEFRRGTPLTKDFSATLISQFSKSGPKTRTCVRWIYQKPA